MKLIIRMDSFERNAGGEMSGGKIAGDRVKVTGVCQLLLAVTVDQCFQSALKDSLQNWVPSKISDVNQLKIKKN